MEFYPLYPEEMVPNKDALPQFVGPPDIDRGFPVSETLDIILNLIRIYRVITTIEEADPYNNITSIFIEVIYIFIIGKSTEIDPPRTDGKASLLGRGRLT
uniref:Uncharacterized protein n=1 Tax=Pithovirus LCPAC201 TaxID=2506591 RepID=A0A481Z482_9VIRU|nr:MAG: hypothetical protein LCPAC201_00190 [Pithovirus LCPAC201]